MLVEQCAPTLAGVKPANLFRFGEMEVETIHQFVTDWGRRLPPKGIRAVVLKECRKTCACMVYVSREAWLGRGLAKW